MKYIYFITLLVLASVTLSSAQQPVDFGNLSPDCKDQLTKLLGDKDLNACFPFGSVASLLTVKGISDQAALKNAADAICQAPKCSDDLVTKTQNSVKNACQSDLNNPNSIAVVANVALTLYSPTRDSICYKNYNGTYCFIESQAAAQQILQNAPKDQSVVLTFGSAPKNEVCTPCNKAIFNTYLNYQKDHPDAFTNIKNVSNQNIDDAKNALQGKCGKDFLDGKVGDSTEDPNKFQQSINQKSDATSLIANRMGYVVLVGVVLAML